MGDSLRITRLAKANDLVTRRVAGETIVVPVRCHVADLDSIYTLNEPGSRIWELIDGRNRIDDIVQAICREYEIQPDEAARDVDEFLSALEAEKLTRSCETGEL
jgi:hypothetical protein